MECAADFEIKGAEEGVERMNVVEEEIFGGDVGGEMDSVGGGGVGWC